MGWRKTPTPPKIPLPVVNPPTARQNAQPQNQQRAKSATQLSSQSNPQGNYEPNEYPSALHHSKTEVL